MARAKTQLENYLVYGVCEKSRRVYFGSSLAYATDDDNIGGFTQCSCEYAIRAIERMALEHPKIPIEIHMNSYGGDAYAMLALYDVIHDSTCQIKFFGKGVIMSAATWIMAGCDERHLYPNTTMMVHKGSAEFGGNLTDVEITIEEEKRLQDKLEEIYAKNSRMPKVFWSKVCQRDLYLTAEETVELGLADRIVHPKKRGNFRKIRDRHLGTKINKNKMKKIVNRLMDRVKIDPIKEIIVNDHSPEPVDDRLTIETLDEEKKDAIHKQKQEDPSGQDNSNDEK